MRTRDERRRLDERERTRLERVARRKAGLVGPWFDPERGRAVNVGRGKRSAWLKRQASKATRRSDGRPGGRGAHRKVFDYWWELC